MYLNGHSLSKIKVKTQNKKNKTNEITLNSFLDHKLIQECYLV